MNKIYLKFYCRFGTGGRLLLSLLLSMFLVQVADAQPSYARKENNNWVGNLDVENAFQYGVLGAGINFDSGSPESFVCNWSGGGIWGTLNDGTGDHTTGATVSDAAGQLLFYTDGLTVFDRTGNYMLNGQDILNVNGNLGPDSVFTHVNRDGAVIMPVPGNSHKYYIFSAPFIWAHWPGTSTYWWQWYGRLYATVVDMELNNGLGGVDTSFRGVHIADSLVGNLQGITGDNCDNWLLAFGSDGKYKAFNVNAAGINHTPVVSILSPPLSPYPYELNVSPDRHKVAMALGSEVQVADFDPATGLLSNDFLIGSQQCRFVAFSANSGYLYLSGIIGLRQYDLNDLSAPFTLLMMNNYTAWEFDSPLRLGPDNKIYFSYMTVTDDGWGINYPACINQPDVYGAACQPILTPDQDLLILKGDFTTLPQEVPVLVYDTVSEVREAPICFHKPPVLSPGVDGTDYHWMVNTIGTTFVRKGNDSTDTLLATDPGTYAVQYFTSSPCTFHRDTFIVNDVNYSLYLGPDRLSCDGSPVSLDAGAVAGAAYLWQDSSVSSKLEADTSGLYWVEVDKQGCTARDSIAVTIMVQQDLGEDTLVCIEDAISIPLHAHIPPGATVLWSTGATTPSIQAQDSGLYWVQVKYADCSVSDSTYIHAEYCDCAVLFPSAFSPNSDGVNDRFGPVADGACPITDYRMEIYNRWGQRVYVSFKPGDSWDGAFNGKPADAGTYMYRVQGRAGLRYTVLQQKGDVTLIR